MDVLVACFGNVLRGDDGFGAAVARHLVASPVPAGVRVLDVGTGGIHLVQELLDPVDALVVVDAVDLGRRPGAVLVIDPDVRDLEAAPLAEWRDQLADTHYATPQRALMLARALGVLPAATVMVGCQTTAADELAERLSPAVAEGVATAAAEVRRVVTELGVPWT
jgi:hydrogenase maturation protease